MSQRSTRILRMRKRAQSTVEYLLMVTAVVAVIIALTAGNGGLFKVRLNDTIMTVINGMQNEAIKMTNAINN